MAADREPPMPRIQRTAVLSALATALYIIVVATVMFYAGQARRGLPPTPLVPIAMLMLLVFSVALTGALIFVRPALWYLDGMKQDALLLLAWTLGFLFVLASFAMAALIFLAPMGH